MSLSPLEAARPALLVDDGLAAGGHCVRERGVDRLEVEVADRRVQAGRGCV
jgi:hypothetical protein